MHSATVRIRILFLIVKYVQYAYKNGNTRTKMALQYVIICLTQFVIYKHV